MSAPGHVYFMRPVGQDGPVKIGCSTMVEERIKALSSWAPFPLELAGLIPGDTVLEGRFHLKFMADRVHGEWFAASAEMSATIASVVAGTFDIATLPTGPRVNWTNRRANEWSPERRRGIGLRARLRNVLHKSGLEPAKALTTAAERFEELPADEQDDVERRVIAFCKDPLNSGAVLPYPWCPEKFASWAQAKNIVGPPPPYTFQGWKAA